MGYFFLPSFEEGLGLLEGAGLAGGAVFLAEAGFEAREPLVSDVLAETAAVSFLATDFAAAPLEAFGSGSVFREAEAGADAEAVAAADCCCLAASFQFGKNNSIRWREMELARRQRGQWAS